MRAADPAVVVTGVIVLWHSALTIEVHPRFSLYPRSAFGSGPHSPAARQDGVPPYCTFPLCCLRRFDDEIALTASEIIARIGSDNPLERLTEGSVGLVADRPSNVYELLVTLLE